MEILDCKGGGDQKQELLALTVIRPRHCNRRPFKDCQSFAMIKLSQGWSCDAIPLGCRRSVYIYDIQKNRISGEVDQPHSPLSPNPRPSPSSSHRFIHSIILFEHSNHNPFGVFRLGGLNVATLAYPH